MDFWVYIHGMPISISLTPGIYILSIPTSSAPAERVFSACGGTFLGKGNRISDINPECEAHLGMNKVLLHCQMNWNKQLVCCVYIQAFNMNTNCIVLNRTPSWTTATVPYSVRAWSSRMAF